MKPFKYKFYYYRLYAHMIRIKHTKDSEMSEQENDEENG